MKILNHKYFDLLYISESSAETLVVENPELLRNLIEELVNQVTSDSGDYILSDTKNDPMKLSSSVLLITDIFHFENAGKSLKTKINNLLVSEYSDVDGREQLMADINRIGIEICHSFPHPLTFKSTLTFPDIIKLLDFSLDIDEGSFWECFLDYITVSFQLLGYRLLVTLNLKDFIAKQEYDELLKNLSYRNIPLLMIESRQHEELDDSNYIRIIDSDLCVL